MGADECIAVSKFKISGVPFRQYKVMAISMFRGPTATPLIPPDYPGARGDEHEGHDFIVWLIGLSRVQQGELHQQYEVQMQKIPRLEVVGPELRLHAATHHLDSLNLACDDEL